MDAPRLPLHIHVAAWHAGSDDDRRQGLEGYLQLQVGHRLIVDGITLRRTMAGLHTLSFPCRRDSRGQTHPIVRPTDRETRAAIEAAVLQQLRVAGILHG